MQLGGGVVMDVGSKKNRGSGKLLFLDVGGDSGGIHSLCEKSLNCTLLIYAFFYTYGSL